MTSKHPETLALHAGWRRDSATNAVAVPIYQTTAFQFDDAEHAADLFGLRKLGNIYTRIMNPTQDALEQRLAALEGGVAALALASGQAASAIAVQNLARAGDNIVSSTDLYGGTWNLFANTFRDQGLEVRFVDPADPEAFARATDARTRAYYAETLPNPKLRPFPIAEVAAIGRPLGIPLIMDNTAAPTLIVRPFDHGAAVVMYSADQVSRWSRQLTIAGVIVDGGNFDWSAHPERQPALNTPDRELPRRHLGGGGPKPLGPDCLHPEGAGHPAARSRRGAQPVQRIPDPAGHRNLAVAHAREHCREHSLRWRNYLVTSARDVTRVIHPAFDADRAPRLT